MLAWGGSDRSGALQFCAAIGLGSFSHHVPAQAHDVLDALMQQYEQAGLGKQRLVADGCAQAMGLYVAQSTAHDDALVRVCDLLSPPTHVGACLGLAACARPLAAAKSLRVYAARLRTQLVTAALDPQVRFFCSKHQGVEIAAAPRTGECGWGA